MILPLFDYAHFMIESSRKCKVEKLGKLQEKAIRYVEKYMYYNMDVYVLYHKYNVQKHPQYHKHTRIGMRLDYRCIHVGVCYS